LLGLHGELDDITYWDKSLIYYCYLLLLGLHGPSLSFHLFCVFWAVKIGPTNSVAVIRAQLWPFSGTSLERLSSALLQVCSFSRHLSVFFFYKIQYLEKFIDLFHFPKSFCIWPSCYSQLRIWTVVQLCGVSFALWSKGRYVWASNCV